MITGVVLARNEEHHIADCLAALRPHVQEIILIDMESSDRTVELAHPLVDQVLIHPLVRAFDAAQNIATPAARFEWLWFVDADERIPNRTGQFVTQLIREQGHLFESLTIPFKTYFCGQWMQHCGWWPGYTMPRVMKRGFFRFSERLHGGVEIKGRHLLVPPDPELGVDHYGYRSIEHYIEKFNRYTTTEAHQMATGGQAWHWSEATRHMVRDLWKYYERDQGQLDGERGWILSWLSGQYRWLSHAKLLDLEPQEPGNNGPPNIPESLDEVLDVMAAELAALRAKSPEVPLGIVWHTPIWDPSGYADEGRAFAKALASGDRELSLSEIPWSDKRCQLDQGDAVLLRALARKATTVVCDNYQLHSHLGLS